MTENKGTQSRGYKETGRRQKVCGAEALYYTEAFLSGPMCGRCLPCSLGSYEAKVRLQNIIEGKGDRS